MPKLKQETLTARKSQILKAALICFAKKGYHQTTMDDIVVESGLSKGGLYVHFSSKKDLFLSLFDWFVEEFRISSMISVTGASVEDSFADFLHGMIDTSKSDPFRELSALMTDVWAQNSHDPDIHAVVKQLYAQTRKPLTELIQRGIDEGIFRPVNALATANIYIAIFEGLMIQSMIEEATVDWSAVSQTLDVISNGLLEKK